MVVRGTPCRSSTRASVSSMSGVGPPPPSPQPNGSRLRADSGWSLKSRAERRSSLHARLAVVGVGGREVREHGRAVDADPAERVVLRRRVAVPRQLLGEEAGHARAAHELRQLAVVAEHVGVPEHGRPPPELAREEALAVQELAHERFARGQVAVRLDPAAADGQPAPGRDLRADALPQLRRARLDPGVLLRLRAGEAVRGIALEQAQLRGEAAHALAVGLLERPQPGRVDVGVADRRDRVDMGAVAAREQVGEDRPRGRPAGAVVLAPRVAEPVEPGRQLARPGRVEIRLVHQRHQHGQVLRERPGLGVEARELAALEGEGGRRERRPLGRRVALRPAEQPVAGDLDRRLDPLAGPRALAQARVRAPELRAADEPLDRLAVEPERRLGVGFQQQVDRRAGPLRRHRRREPQPPRRPQRPERHAQPGVGVRQRGRVGGSEPVHRPGDAQPVDRACLGVHEFLHAPRHLPDALARVVGMHRLADVTACVRTDSPLRSRRSGAAAQLLRRTGAS